MRLHARIIAVSAALASVTGLGVLQAPAASAQSVHYTYKDCDFYVGIPVHHYYSRDDQRISVDGSWKCRSSHTFHMTSAINYKHPALGRAAYEQKNYEFKNKKSAKWSITHQCKFDYPNSGAKAKTWQTVWLREYGGRWETPSVNLYCGMFK